MRVASRGGPAAFGVDHHFVRRWRGSLVGGKIALLGCLGMSRGSSRVLVLMTTIRNP